MTGNERNLIKLKMKTSQSSMRPCQTLITMMMTASLVTASSKIWTMTAVRKWGARVSKGLIVCTTQLQC